MLQITNEEIGQNPDNIAARVIRLVQRHEKRIAISMNVVSGVHAGHNKLGITLAAS